MTDTEWNDLEASSMGSNVVVIYHANCWDGFCAAWLLHRVFPSAEFVPAHYGQAPPDVTGKTVYLVDFSYPRDVLIELWRAAQRLVVLDHHKTAQADLEGLPAECESAGFKGPEIVFDMDKSGARLTWEFLWDEGFGTEFQYVVPALGTARFTREHAPWLVDYTEDRDLWRWALPNSKAITTALRSHPLDFKLWNKLQDYDPNSLIADGLAILRSESVVIDTHVRHAREIELAGHRILAVNATVLFSDIAGRLAEGRPFGAAYFDRGDGKRQWSLRSTKDGVDVSEVARSRGGGGHKHAAGFEEDFSVIWKQYSETV